MGVTTMKTSGVRIISALLILSVLWVKVPGVRADDDTDYVTEINRYVDQIYQDQKQTDDYLNSIQDGIDQVTKQRDDILNSIGNAQAEAPVAVPQSASPVAGPVAAPQVKLQSVPTDPVAFAQMVRQNQERVQQQILQGQQQLLQQAGRLAAPQVVPQQVAMPKDPAAFQQMVLQNQERVRQQIQATQQQILQRSQEIMQRSQQQMMRVQQ